VSPASPTLNQTYATLPLSFLGRSIESIVANDENPALVLLDVQDDIKKIASDKLPPVNWGWYQEGYDHKPTDGTGPATYDSYITHHNGPQYFGYIGDNPKVASNLHGLNDFFTAREAAASGERRVLRAWRLRQPGRPQAARSQPYGASELRGQRRPSGLFRRPDLRSPARRNAAEVGPEKIEYS
jgi:phospholipase C